LEPQVRLSGDGVVAVALVRDDVVAVTAGEGVVPVAALDDVIAGTAGDGVIAVTGVDDVVECRAGDGVIAVAAVDYLGRGGTGAVDGVIAGSADDGITDLYNSDADDAIYVRVGRRDLAAGGRGKVAVRLVRGEGILTDRDLHVRILCRPRAVTDRYFVIWGCQRHTNGAGKHHAGHRNNGNRS